MKRVSLDIWEYKLNGVVLVGRMIDIIKMVKGIK